MGARKTVLTTSFLVIFLLLNSTSTFLNYASKTNGQSDIISFDDYALNTYNQLNDSASRPSYDVFKKGLTGMYNLIKTKNICKNKYLTLIDYSISCNKKRLWVIDIESKLIVFHERVAHGMKSGNEFARSFSNRANSHKSSLGFYSTGPIYNGKHKTSLKLIGLDKRFNSNALQRGIVIHGAKYVNDSYVKNNGRLGRSFGCPSVSTNINKDLVDIISDGNCLFIFANNFKYLSKTKWLNPISQFDSCVFVDKI